MNCGTDICSVERMQDAIEKIGDSFLKRVFSEEEIAYCEARKGRKYECYAGRFAGKEAVFKAISPKKGEEGNFTEVEILCQENGAPYVVLHGALKMLAKDKKICVSLSHEREFAVAFAVIE